MAKKSLYQTIELAKKNQSKVQLEHLLKTMGVEVNLYLPSKDVHSRVYGNDSNSVDDTPVPITALVTGDDFFPSSGSASGSFVEGWLYTFSDKVVVGAELEIESQDGRSRRYTIEHREAIGMTTDLFSRWKLVSKSGGDNE